MTTTRTASPTARKVVGSLAVLGAAAAVAGLGTYGNFTDSTTPMSTELATGILSINLTQPGIAVPASVSNLVPGDSVSRTINLVNDGTLPLSSVSVVSTAPTSSILTTDQTNGLQLAIRSCSAAWTQGGTQEAPTYSCSGTERSVMTGPAVGNAALSNPNSLTAGGVDHLVFTLSLPSTAGNEFQGKAAGLSLSFTGVQRAGTAR